MKKTYFLFLITAMLGCNGQSGDATGTDTTSINMTATVEPDRDNVNSQPVASYTKDLPGNLNKWQFHVDLKETKQTFDYLLEMQYQEVTGADTIHFPNFGMEPRPEIRKGENDLECIIGFLDKEDKFREYIKVFIENDQLQMKTVKHYAVYEK